MNTSTLNAESTSSPMLGLIKLVLLCMVLGLLFFVPLLILLINNLVAKPLSFALPKFNVNKEPVPALRLKI